MRFVRGFEAVVKQQAGWNSRPGEMRRGIRVAVVNCTDPARVGEFHEWYDAYAVHCTTPGLLVNAHRYENPLASGTHADPTFLALYDIVAPDLLAAWPETDLHMKSIYADYPDYISVVMAGTYELVSSSDSSESKQAPTGVYLLMSDAGESALQDFTTRVVGTGSCSKVSHFTFVEGFPAVPPQHMLLIETRESDPLSALRGIRDLADAASETRLSGCFRLYSAYP